MIIFSIFFSTLINIEYREKIPVIYIKIKMIWFVVGMLIIFEWNVYWKPESGSRKRVGYPKPEQVVETGKRVGYPKPNIRADLS